MLLLLRALLFLSQGAMKRAQSNSLLFHGHTATAGTAPRLPESMLGDSSARALGALSGMAAASVTHHTVAAAKIAAAREAIAALLKGYDGKGRGELAAAEKLSALCDAGVKQVDQVWRTTLTVAIS